MRKTKKLKDQQEATEVGRYCCLHEKRKLKLPRLLLPRVASAVAVAVGAGAELELWIFACMYFYSFLHHRFLLS